MNAPTIPETRSVPIGDLKPDHKNAIEHDEKNLAAIRASIARWGQVEDLVVQKSSMRVLGGNGRLQVMKELQYDSVSVKIVDLADNEADALAIALNRAGELRKWKDRQLAETLERIKKADPIAALATGFNKGELKKRLKALRPPDTTQIVEDAATGQPPANPRTKIGDVWHLGGHRLMCGDATERSDYAFLLDGETPKMLLTDPPYGVAYQDAGKSRIQGDLTQAAFPVAMAICSEMLDENGRAYVFCATDQIAMADRVFNHHFGMRPRLCLWVKESFILRHNGYHSQYEMVCYLWKGSGGGPDYWYGDRKQSDVWEISRDKDRVHPTQKPVALCAIPIRNSTQEGEVILEPFAGSGTTLIAAEQLGRRCYALELDPGFCDVIVDRWEKFTGNKATHHEGGVT